MAWVDRLTHHGGVDQRAGPAIEDISAGPARRLSATPRASRALGKCSDRAIVPRTGYQSCNHRREGEGGFGSRHGPSPGAVGDVGFFDPGAGPSVARWSAMRRAQVVRVRGVAVGLVHRRAPLSVAACSWTVTPVEPSTRACRTCSARGQVGKWATFAPPMLYGAVVVFCHHALPKPVRPAGDRRRGFPTFG